MGDTGLNAGGLAGVCAISIRVNVLRSNPTRAHGRPRPAQQEQLAKLDTQDRKLREEQALHRCEHACFRFLDVSLFLNFSQLNLIYRLVDVVFLASLYALFLRVLCYVLCSLTLYLPFCIIIHCGLALPPQSQVSNEF